MIFPLTLVGCTAFVGAYDSVFTPGCTVDDKEWFMNDQFLLAVVIFGTGHSRIHVLDHDEASPGAQNEG